MQPPNVGRVAGYNTNSVPQYTPEQMNLFSQMMGLAGPQGDLYKMASGDQSAFQPREQKAWQDFSGMQGNLASRFSGMGTGGRQSSGFQNTATAAGSDFALSLADQRNNLQRDALKDLTSMSESLLGNRPYQQFLSKPKKKKSFWESLLGGGASLGGAALGGMFGGIPGATLGGSLGSSFAEAFQ